MSVDFSQFFNGPIRDSLIAQVSGFLDIPRQQATTAYDKAVAMVIGTMARQAGKPEGAQELITHIQRSQTQANLTSSALSPTVLTNDQFAQIVTMGESEQATILGAQLEPVAGHLEVATGLDRKSVGSLLAIIVPFVLSYLKNSIANEITPAQSLPVLLANQAPHVAPQLDAPALAALGGDSLEDLFGPDALAAVDAQSNSPSHNGRQTSTQPAIANERSRSGWFKWVLILAVILAAIAWIKSCTQSDTVPTENAKPAEQEQSATGTPAVDAAGSTAPVAGETPATTPAQTAPTDNASETQAPSETAPSETAPASSQGETPDQAKTTEPSTSFPAPATAETGVTPATVDSCASPSPGTSTSQTEPPAGNPDSASTSAAAAAVGTAVSKGHEPEPTPATSSSGAAADNNATSKVAGQNQPDATENPATGEPTYGQASDSMDSATSAAGDTHASTRTPDADTTGKNAISAKGGGATSATTSSTAAASSASEEAGTEEAALPGKTSEQSDTNKEGVTTGKTTTFAAGSSGAPEASPAAEQEPAQPAASPKTDVTPDSATPSGANTVTAEKQQTAAASMSGAQGKTTTFTELSNEAATSAADAAQAETPNATETVTDAASTKETTKPDEPAVSGKTTTFGETGDTAATHGSRSPGAVPGPAATAPAGTEKTGAAEPTVEGPASATADVSQAPTTAAAQVRFEHDGDILRISGTVPDESVRNSIVKAAKFADGHSRIEDNVKVDSQVAATPFDDYSGMLSLLRGYQGVDVTLDKETLTLNGQVPSQAEKDALATKMQNLVGSNTQIINQVKVVAKDAASTAVSAADALAPAQVQFASGSAQIDQRYHETLNQLAQQLKDSGKTVRLVGFADESGNAAVNESLSKQRAESVKAYLVLHGVQADRIQTDGQGAQAPVADNTTQEGRAKNRRVQFQEQE